MAMNLRIEYVSPTKLVGYENNSRTHSDTQIEQVAASIKEFGFVNPILVDSKNIIVAGHGRLAAATKLGLKEVPIIRLGHLSDRQRRALTIADNKIALNAGWDFQKLAEEINELALDEFDLDILGFDEQELEAILKEDESLLPDDFQQPDKNLRESARQEEQPSTERPALNEGLVADDETPELPSQPVSQRGDVWLLGNHRLLCGDSTDPENYKLVMGMDTPVLMVTDPPYGVNYTPDWRDEAGLSEAAGRVEGLRTGGLSISEQFARSLREAPEAGGVRLTGRVLNDDRADWFDAYRHFDGEVAYVWHASSQMHIVREDLLKCGFEIKYQIIWAKHRFVISRGDYHYQHEPCFYAVKKGKRHNWQGARDQSTVWHIANLNSVAAQADPANVKTGHGTQKPVECMLRPILNNTAVGNVVYDPFAGSGSTIIASEKSSRKARAIELSEDYTDLIVMRWQNYTGLKAVHFQTGKSFEELKELRYGETNTNS